MHVPEYQPPTEYIVRNGALACMILWTLSVSGYGGHALQDLATEPASGMQRGAEPPKAEALRPSNEKKVWVPTRDLAA